MQRRAPLLALLAGLLAGAATGDVLVLRDGGTVETDGPWTVQGQLIVVKLMDGKLGSIRTRDVDLDASAAATLEASRPKVEPPKPPPRKAVLTLTDDDVPKAPLPLVAPPPATGDGAPVGGTVAAGTPAANGNAAPVVVVETYEESYDSDAGAFVVSGILRNNGEAAATGVIVVVEIYNGEGEKEAEREARVATSALGPGRTTSFVASFAEASSASRVQFRVTHRSILFESPEAATPAPESAN